MEKFNTLYTELLDEISVSTGLKNELEKFNKIHNIFSENFKRYFYTKCKSEYDWLYQHEELRGTKEYDKKKEELVACLAKNDKHHLNQAIEEYHEEYLAFRKKSNQELNECKKLKTDKEITDCIKDKLTNSSYELIKLLNKYNTKFTELNKNLKL